MRCRRWTTALIGVAVLTALLPSVSRAVADGGASDRDASGDRELRIERSLACPQCTDLPLDVCEQDICNDMRSIIHLKIAAGESDAAIRDFFVQRYGLRVLLSPPKRSLTVVVWLVPFAGLAAGAAAGLVFVRAARRRPSPAPPAAAAARVFAELRSRVERDLRGLE